MSEMKTTGIVQHHNNQCKKPEKVYIFRREIEEVSGKISDFFYDTRKKLRFFELGDTITTDALRYANRTKI